eukprot:gene3077-5247_t
MTQENFILNSSELTELKDILKVRSEEQLNSMLTTKGGLYKLRVNELKTIGRYITDKKRIPFRLSGNKPDLIDRLYAILTNQPTTESTQSTTKRQHIRNTKTIQTARTPLLHEMNDEETGIMKYFEINPTNKGHQDPFYKIVEVLHIYAHQNSQSSIFSIPILPENIEKIQKKNYSLHIQLHKFSTLEPKDWIPEVKFSFNSTVIELPKILKRTKKKNTLVSSSPMIIQSSDVSKINRVSIYVPQWISFEGVIAFFLVKELTVPEIIEEYITPRKSNLNDSTQEEKLVLKTAQFLDLSTIDDFSKSINQKDLEKSIESLDTIKKLVFKESLEQMEEDDDIICNQEEIVTLKDNVTLIRIETPVKTTSCKHKQCFDLKSYLIFSHQSKVWNCPVCNKPCTVENLIIDELMTEILQKYPDSEKVKIHQDGTYEIESEKKNETVKSTEKAKVEIEIIDLD